MSFYSLILKHFDQFYNYNLALFFKILNLYPSYRRVYRSRPILISYTDCEENNVKTQINNIPLLFLCEASTEPSAPTEEPSQASTNPTDGAPTDAATTKPTTSTVATAAPTNSAGVPECPPNSNTYQRSYYTYSSL